MRKLASVQKILAIRPIQGADFIVEADIMGWKAVVKKGQFNVGDFGCFFEVDSILPTMSWSEFLRPKKFRIKTCMLKGVLSQGLIMPLSILDQDQLSKTTVEEGFDLTDILGVSKYEPPVRGSGTSSTSAGPFPSCVPKTDEVRIQSELVKLDHLRGSPYAITVKCDGSSFTAVYEDGIFSVCSRNQKCMFFAEKTDNYWKMAIKYNLEQKLKETGLAVQGELCGPGIQKNRLGLKEIDLLVFNVYDTIEKQYLSHDAMMDFCHKNNLRTVPVWDVGSDFNYSLEDLLKKAGGMYEGTKNAREGLVVRSQTGKNRVSFKVLNNDFLLNEED